MRDSNRRMFQAACVLLFVVSSALAGPPAPTINPHQHALPVPSVVRFWSTQELIGVQRSVFETLFGQPWDQSKWEYAIDNPVNGAGVYLGQNHQGQNFRLDIKLYAPVDLATAPLTPAQREQAQSIRFQIATAIGLLSRDDVSIAVIGQVVASNDASGVLRYRFWLNNTTNADGPLFVSIPAPDAAEPDLVAPLQPPTRPREGVFSSTPRLCAECDSEYQLRSDRAYRDCNAQENLARQLRDMTVQNAHQTYADTKEQLDINLAICSSLASAGVTGCLLLCAATGPAILACVLGCNGGFALATAGCLGDYTTDLNAATASRDNDINLANRTFSATVAAAAAFRDTALQDALDDRTACRSNCIQRPRKDDKPATDRPVDPQ